MNDTQRYALAYARRGWPVLPCRGKVPCGDIVHHGVKDATTDPDTLLRWFTDDTLNVAISCERIAVLDVDPRSDDRGRALHDLIADLGPLPADAPRVATGGGGAHIYFAGPVRSAKPRAWLDVKAAGGYVIAPPSIHPDTGRIYTFLIEPTGQLDQLPTRFTTATRGATARTSASEWAQLVRHGLVDGDRNRGLARLTGHLLSKDVHVDLVREIAFMVNERSNPPLAEHEVDRVVASISGLEQTKRKGQR